MEMKHPHCSSLQSESREKHVSHILHPVRVYLQRLSAFGGGQQSPVKPSTAHPGLAEHAAEPAVIVGSEDLEGTLLGILDGDIDGRTDGIADGLMDGDVDGVAEGKESPVEQQSRNVTPSEVGQQSPAKLEQAG